MSAADERLRQLHVIADYQAHYHRPCWAGREGTTSEVLDSLVEEGLLYKEPDKERTRFWYTLTREGMAIVG